MAARTGLVHGTLAYLVWGILPLYFRLLDGVAPLELVGHRILWSLVVVLCLLAWQRELGALRAALLHWRTLGALAGSALFIAINWFTYIWAVEHRHVLAASLGYFLNPLVNVLFGVTLLKERLAPLQWLALALAACGVTVLALGALDTLWISMALATTFGIYGLIRKLVPVGALVGLGIETLLLAPVAAIVVGWIEVAGRPAFGGAPLTTGLLVASGIVTSTPMLLFASGARRLPLVTLGLLQYLAPTLQFLIGLLVFGEAMTPGRWMSFALIWGALALFAGEALRRRRSG